MFTLKLFRISLGKVVNRRYTNILPNQLVDAGFNVKFFSSSSSSSSSLSSFSSSTGQSNGLIRTRNKETIFLDPDVQKILKKITGYNEEKVFSNKPVSGYKPPKYLFLTDEELVITRERARKEGVKNLQMPPVMEPWEEKDFILADESEFQSFDICNLVITDLSQGFSDRNRLIAVREPSGVLRRARWDERYRVNQIYFPVDGRGITVPKMFEPEHLELILDRFDYLFILDRACIQFEPDDPRYIEIVEKTYDHINTHKKFDLLRSTRHFGPMAFYLAWKGLIDPLLQDMKQRKLTEDVEDLIKLYNILHPEAKRKQEMQK